MIDKHYVEVQEHGEQESLFLIKPFEMSLIHGVEKYSSETSDRGSKEKSWKRWNDGGKGKRYWTGRTRQVFWQYRYKPERKT